MMYYATPRMWACSPLLHLYFLDALVAFSCLPHIDTEIQGFLGGGLALDQCRYGVLDLLIG